MRLMRLPGEDAFSKVRQQADRELATRLNVTQAYLSLLLAAVETIGDCYVAVCGLPEPRSDHAVVMARFSRECLVKFSETVKQLEVTLGPDTGDLGVRIGLHSGRKLQLGKRFVLGEFNTCSHNNFPQRSLPVSCVERNLDSSCSGIQSIPHLGSRAVVIQTGFMCLLKLLRF